MEHLKRVDKTQRVASGFGSYNDEMAKKLRTQIGCNGAYTHDEYIEMFLSQ